MQLTVLYDACVLYPAPLRDLLMHLALADLFLAKWSATIHAEWIRNVLAARPDLTRAQLERTRTLMDAHVRDCLVLGYEGLINQLELPDPDDRHVLAAAITGRAERIITFNLRDFPDTALRAYGIAAQHPDLFILQLLEQYRTEFCSAVKRHRSSLRNPPKTVAEYLAILEQQGLPKTVAALREAIDLI